MVAYRSCDTVSAARWRRGTLTVTILALRMLTAAPSLRALAILSLLAVPAMLSWSACGGSTGAPADGGADTGRSSGSGSSSGGGPDASGVPPPQAATACILLGGVSNAASLWNGTTWSVAPGTPP